MKTNDNGIDREMTDAEVAAYDMTSKEMLEQVTAQATADAVALQARREAIRKLKTLGLTDDEIKAIRRA